MSLMRSSYLALKGYTVDVFSSKESLSERDYEDARPVLSAMGIPCGYITPQSPAETYKTRTTGPIKGAVNFATIGNFSLFFIAQCMDGQ
jgi:SecA DEAD-like domain.